MSPAALLAPLAPLRPALVKGRAAFAEVLDQPRHLLAARLTLFLLLLHGSTSWVLDVPLRILCGMMMVSTPFLRSRLAWTAVAASVVWVHAGEWYSIDNHKYLITYWCLVCALAAGARDADRVSAGNARLLIGLCFLFAVGWKILGGGFLDGSFLHYTLLKDSRVEALAMGLGGLDHAELIENRALLRTLRAMPADGIEAVLHTSDGIRRTALGLAWWTLLIEGFVALAFLVHPRSGPGRLRDAALMAFVATTYFILPVTGFAFALALLGFAQCEPERRGTRALYLVLFIAIQLTRVPWDDYVASWID